MKIIKDVKLFKYRVSENGVVLNVPTDKILDSFINKTILVDEGYNSNVRGVIINAYVKDFTDEYIYANIAILDETHCSNLRFENYKITVISKIENENNVFFKNYDVISEIRFNNNNNNI